MLKLRHAHSACLAPLLTACIVLASASSSHAEDQIATPDKAVHKHNGVASCATSACHGKVSPVEGRNVWLNEYHLWSTQDRHSRAYQTLLSDRSRLMAKKLGLANAHTAKVCLDCHADNVPAEKRGAKFQLSDGVACEACHGGSENWLKGHTEPDASHANNVANGLYPTENPYPRAALCLSCHVGSAERFADHQMMAAGHPRLTFELDTFTANQPAHYNIDADYIQRKGSPKPGDLWMTGQIQSAKRLLDMIEMHGGKINSKSLAVYDCHGCHRPMNTLKGQASDDSRQLPPGSIRLADSPLDMISVMYEVLSTANAAQWHASVAALHLGMDNQSARTSAIASLREQLGKLEQGVKSGSADGNTVKALRLALIKRGQQGAYSDFSSAEQAFLAIESLSFGAGDRDKILPALDSLYQSVGDEFEFSPEIFVKSLGALNRQL